MGAYPKPEDIRRPTPVEDTLRRVIDTIPCLVTRSRPDGYVDFVNQRWLEFTGLKLEEVLGWGWRAVLHPQDVEKYMRKWHAALTTGEPFEHEARLRRHDGEYRWFLIRKLPLRDERGDIVSWYGTNHDVEDLKETTEKLRRSEAELRQIIDVIPAHVFILEPDPNFPEGTILPNRQDLEYTGRTLEEARGHLVKVFHPDDRERLQRLRQRALVEGIPFQAEARVRRRDGQYRWFLIGVNPLKDENGRILRWYGTRTDIDDLKRAEDHLRLVIDAIPQQIWSGPADGSLDFCNARWRNELGLSLEDLRGDGWQKMLHPDDRERVLQAWRESVATGMPYEQQERHCMATGIYRWFLSRGLPLRDENGKIVRWFGSNTDIDDQKKAQVALRQSEQRWRAIFENASVGVTLLDASLHYVTVNGAFEHMLGYASDELRSRTCVDLTVEEDRLRHKVLIDELLQGKRDHFEVEKRFRRKDGSLVWTHTSASVVAGTRGESRLWVAIVKNITERKRLGDQLEQERHHLRLVIDTIPQQIWSARGEGSPDFSLDFCNAQWRSYTGLTLEELQGEGWQRILHPDDRERILKAWRESASTGKPFEQEVRRRGADGKYRWFLGLGVPLKDAAGRIVRWYGTNTDIEDRKEAESRLRLVVDTTPAMLYSARPDGYLDFFNQRWLDYLGRSLDDISGWGWTSAVHPDDLEELISKWGHALAAGEPYVNEARIRRADGKYHWMLLRKVPLRDQVGNIVKWYGSGIDVEEQHEARTALQKAFNEIKALRDQLYKENLVLKEQIGQASMFEEMIGSSAALRSVLVHVEKVAPTDSTVLITGETGTGKELVARAIHKRSNRAAQPFVSVNCAAIPPSLVASELFGYEKGAFTGAIERRLGRFELADGGTIFLDEVGDLPPEAQIALLRVLQERTFERVGGGQPISVDVRVLAATNRELQAAVEAATFRQDLFYRLNVFPIHVPPLRDRVEDIPLLVEYFAEQYGRKAGKKIKSIKRKTLELLQAYDWPGNIRELQNVIERAVILCDGDTLAVDETWLQHESPRLNSAARGLGRLEENREREMIKSALRETRGRVSGPGGAAAKLGIPRSTLESRIRSLGIDKQRFKLG